MPESEKPSANKLFGNKERKEETALQESCSEPGGSPTYFDRRYNWVTLRGGFATPVDGVRSCTSGLKEIGRDRNALLKHSTLDKRIERLRQWLTSISRRKTSTSITYVKNVPPGVLIIMANANDDEKGFWREFIAVYRGYPELWKVKSDVYRNRRKKDAAYEKLVEKMKETYPKADRDLVRSKINALRTSYRRELKKVKDSIKSDARTEDVYVPNLWYFTELDFLRNQETQMQGISTVDDTEVDGELKEINETVLEDNSFSRPSQRQSTTKQKLTDDRNAPTENEETKRVKQLDMTRQRLKNTSSESHILAKGWGIEFDKMTADQQLYAKKFIDDILFEGRLGNLHRNSVIINHSSLSFSPHSTGYHQYPHSSNRPSPYSAPPSPY